MRIFGVRGNAVRWMRDPIGNAGRLFARYGNVASLVRGPLRIVNPGPTPNIPVLQHAKGAGVVCVNGAEYNREVLTDHERYFMIALPGRLFPSTAPPPEREKPVTRTMTGLFHVNSDEHRKHRRLLMPAFAKTRIEAYRDDMVGITNDVLAQWRAGETRDVHADMTELTLRVATKTLFGGDEGERGSALARKMQEWLLTMIVRDDGDQDRARDVALAIPRRAPRRHACRSARRDHDGAGGRPTDDDPQPRRRPGPRDAAGRKSPKPRAMAVVNGSTSSRDAHRTRGASPTGSCSGSPRSLAS